MGYDGRWPHDGLEHRCTDGSRSPCRHELPLGTPDSFADFRTWNAVYFGVLVNGRGRRFVREDGPFQAVSNAQNAQPGYGRNCWYIFDETMYEGMEDSLDEYKEKGWLFEGASVEELAEAVGIDAQGLADELARYAGFFETGVDEDFARDLNMTIPFTGKRLFAFTTNSNVFATVGGLCIDGNCSVLNMADENPSRASMHAAMSAEASSPAIIPGIFPARRSAERSRSGTLPRKKRSTVSWDRAPRSMATRRN